MSEPTPAPLTHYFRVRKHLPQLFTRPCRVLVRGPGPGPRNVLIEFADGTKIVTTRFSVRKRKEEQDAHDDLSDSMRRL